MARFDSRKRQPNVAGGRSVRRVVKVTLEQNETLQGMAEELNVSVARLLVESTLSQSRGETAAERRELLTNLFLVQRRLAAIGNNLNQIAKVANTSGEIDSALWPLLVHLQGSMTQLDDCIDALSFQDVN